MNAHAHRSSSVVCLPLAHSSGVGVAQSTHVLLGSGFDVPRLRKKNTEGVNDRTIILDPDCRWLFGSVAAKKTLPLVRSKYTRSDGTVDDAMVLCLKAAVVGISPCLCADARGGAAAAAGPAAAALAEAQVQTSSIGDVGRVWGKGYGSSFVTIHNAPGAAGPAMSSSTSSPSSSSAPNRERAALFRLELAPGSTGMSSLSLGERGNEGPSSGVKDSYPLLVYLVIRLNMSCICFLEFIRVATSFLSCITGTPIAAGTQIKVVAVQSVFDADREAPFQAVRDARALKCRSDHGRTIAYHDDSTVILDPRGSSRSVYTERFLCTPDARVRRSIDVGKTGKVVCFDMLPTVETEQAIGVERADNNTISSSVEKLVAACEVRPLYVISFQMALD